MVHRGLLFASLLFASMAANIEAKSVSWGNSITTDKSKAASEFLDDVDKTVKLYFRELSDDDDSWDNDLAESQSFNIPGESPAISSPVSLDDRRDDASFTTLFPSTISPFVAPVLQNREESQEKGSAKREVFTPFLPKINYFDVKVVKAPEEAVKAPEEAPVSLRSLQGDLAKTADDLKTTKQRVDSLTAQAAEDREAFKLLKKDFENLKENLLDVLLTAAGSRADTSGFRGTRTSQQSSWSRLTSSLQPAPQ